MLRSAASDPVIHCLPMSHKNEATRIWVKSSGEALNNFKSKGF